ncbi:deaminase domain-containing protein [Planococcus citreus]|uniref:Putative deaminase of polymorphic toxin system n=1 Tax=Planococcus citreus TaxID=1373 RepID=A0A497YHF0_9BACL|nr:deaminase domain-containing protein [Planococcus citreus]RLJ86627.1 putative deaminase of polymorphic toxin system [Planococcus citreus]
MHKKISPIHSRMQHRAEKLREQLPMPLSFTGNLGLAEVRIKKIPRKLKAHSSINDKSSSLGANGYIFLKTKRKFKTYKVKLKNSNTFLDRKFDTEAKVLEYIAGYLSNNTNTRGEIFLYTEKKPCISCENVIKQFKNKYPGVLIKVFWDRS